MNAIFYLKDSKRTVRTVYLRVNGPMFKNGRFVYSTGLKVNKNDWMDGQLKPGKDDPKRSVIKKIDSFILDYPTNFPSDQGLINLEEELNKKFNPNRLQKPAEIPKNTKSILNLWKEFLDGIEKTVERRTFIGYRNSYEAVESFLKSHKSAALLPGQFTINHFNKYLGTLREGNKPNTVAKRLKHLKAAFTHIQDDLKIPVGFELRRIKYKETAGLKISLSEDELKAYEDAADLPAHLVKVRDLVLIQCNTGLRISDRKRIDKNLRGNKIIIEAQKTRTTIEIPITPVIRKILEKYDYQLPDMSEKTYREGIKAIHAKLFPNQTIQVREKDGFKNVFVHEEISSHDMVRTFISLSANRGMAIPSIAKLTGKSVATLLKNYLVESQKVADQEMEKAWGSAPLKVAR
jgi:hypothetical protein